MSETRRDWERPGYDAVPAGREPCAWLLHLENGTVTVTTRRSFAEGDAKQICRRVVPVFDGPPSVDAAWVEKATHAMTLASAALKVAQAATEYGDRHPTFKQFCEAEDALSTALRAAP